ncbi:UNVERIFIED_CONTAM: hypothetical protein PYX00_011375 [Menopon gallinae]|uniref:Uncharacterized protein n=1 Tax=Menopon gallinae TaxID=328185 RepID=A0AAW2H7J0_9NEOP
MTKNTCEVENSLIDEIEASTLEAISSIEEAIRNDMSIESIQLSLAKKWKEACSYFKECIKPSESYIKVLPYRKQKVDFLTSNLLLYHFMSIDREIASTYMGELEESKRFSDAEVRKLKSLEEWYLESETIVNGIAQYNFSAAERFISRNLEYFSVNTRLRFGIAALKFLKLVCGGRKIDAIKFLEGEMKPFLENQECKREIRKMLLFLIQDVGACTLDEYMKQVTGAAREDYCFLMDIPICSFLNMIFVAGTKSVPVLIEASNVFKDIEVEKLIDFELVVKLPKGVGKAFHSLFVCPVLKSKSLRITIEIDISHIHDIDGGIRRYMGQFLLKHSTKLGGILISYNVKLISNRGTIVHDNPNVFILADMDVLVLDVPIGCRCVAKNGLIFGAFYSRVGGDDYFNGELVVQGFSACKDGATRINGAQPLEDTGVQACCHVVL